MLKLAMMRTCIWHFRKTVRKAASTLTACFCAARSRSGKKALIASFLNPFWCCLSQASHASFPDSPGVRHARSNKVSSGVGKITDRTFGNVVVKEDVIFICIFRGAVCRAQPKIDRLAECSRTLNFHSWRVHTYFVD